MENDLDLSSKEKLESANLKFVDLINEAHTKNSSDCKINKQLRIPNSIFYLIKQNKKLKRAFSNSHCPIIKNKINNTTNRIKRETKKLNNQKWNELCHLLGDMKASEPIFWKTIKKIETNNLTIECKILPNLNDSNEAKANKLANYYETVFKNEAHTNTNFNNLFKYQASKRFNGDITLIEVKEALKLSKSTKSTGLDGVSFKTLKNLPDNGLLIFGHLNLLRFDP